MSSIPKIYDEFLKIIEKEPEENLFAKLAKYDLKYRILIHILKEHKLHLKEEIEAIFKETKKLDQRYFEELSRDYIENLFAIEMYDNAIEFLKKFELKEDLVIDLIASSLGLEGLKYIDNFSENKREELIGLIWLNETRKGNSKNAYEEIRKIKDVNTRLRFLVDLAEILVKENPELAREIINYLSRSITRYKNINPIHIARLIKIKCEQDDNCIDFFNKNKHKVDISQYNVFLPILAVNLLRKSNESVFEKILDEYISRTKDERIYVDIISYLSKNNQEHKALKYILRIKDLLVISQAYIELIDNTDSNERAINYSRLAVDNLVKWFDENFLLLRRMAERVKQEDKNYSKANISQIIFYHPQISAYFRNLTTIFYNTLKSITEKLLNKGLISHALHLLSYICTTKRLGCDLRATVAFEKYIKENDTEKALKLIKNADTASLLALKDRLDALRKIDAFPNVLIDSLRYFSEKNLSDKVNSLIPLVLDIKLFNDALKALESMKDEKTRIELKLVIANRILEENGINIEDIVNEAKQYIEKHSLEESSNIARLLAPVLFKLKRYDETLELVKKFLSAKDKWLAGLIISSIFKK